MADHVPHTQALFDAAAVRAIDASAIAAGTPGYQLMRSAAASAFALLRRRWPRARRLAVLCGPGNNGGDGYVLAELARRSGREVQLLQLSEPSGDSALQAHRDALAVGLRPQSFSPEALDGVELVVDALFGTGLSRAPDGEAARAIAAVNAHPAPCLALDIPSGLDADTGATPGAAIVATATVTFIAAKLGLYTGEGPRCCGELSLERLGVDPRHAAVQTPVAERLCAVRVATLLPPRHASAHKGSAGHVLVVGGNRGMGGAVRLASEAALRSGAGLVSVACHPDCAAAVGAGRPELMVHACADADALAPLLARASALVLGPGLGSDDWARALYAAAKQQAMPTVLDADGLNLLAADPGPCPQAVLTPHPAEAARLLGADTAAVQANRPDAIRALVQRYQACVVLKGPGSLIAAAEGPLYLCDRGNPGMASGGMGDLLSGVIAALLGEGCPSLAAAAAGTWLHSAAADIAARDGQTGMLAGDLLPPLRRLRDRPVEP